MTDPTQACLDSLQEDKNMETLVKARPDAEILLKHAFKLGFCVGALWAVEQDKR